MRPYDRHNAFDRVWQAVEYLAINSGHEGKKLEKLRTTLVVFTDRDFDTEKQKKLYQGIRDIYSKYPPIQAIKPEDYNRISTLTSSPPQIKRKLKRNIVDLFYSLTLTE